MQAHRVETTIDKDNILVIKDIPFQPGDRVEVIILERSPEVKQAKRYPLRGAYPRVGGAYSQNE